MNNTQLAIGLVSGTSGDGINAAAIRVSRADDGFPAVETLAFTKREFDNAFRAQLFEQFWPNQGSVKGLCELNFVMGEMLAECAAEVADAAGIALADVDVIGSHGQTVFHQPALDGDGVRSNLAIGEPTVIAERTGVTTVADLHVRDMAAGGVGAPLVAFADFVLFRNDRTAVAVQNIGGITNGTIVPRGAQLEDVFGFDMGPGMMVIDWVVGELTRGAMEYDADGAMAAKGTPDFGLVEEFVDHPFIARTPPKSTGREVFGADFSRRLLERAQQRALSDDDVVATATALTARTIALNYERFVTPRVSIDELFICGGGGLNPTLVGYLRDAFPGVHVGLVDARGVDGDAKEAIAFALIGAETVVGRPSNVPGATGAKRPVIQGKVVLP